MASGDVGNGGPLPPGYVIGGKYVLGRMLGSGGMGAVYEAQNSWTGRRVAIKVLLSEHAQRADVIDRFMREAQATTQIAHPNIVDVLDMGQDATTGALFIVQEYLDGIDLARWLIQHGPCSPAEAVSLLAPVMGALVAAHQRGVIHRDIKPENIFLVRTANGAMTPKLIDFGISKFVGGQQEERSRTATGMAVGTPQYMSPEQARGDRAVDARSDVWSIGVVLYELLCGMSPYDAPSHNLLLVQIITQEPMRIESHHPSIDPAVAAVVHHALQHDPERRLQSMRELLAALLEVVGMDASVAASLSASFTNAPEEPTTVAPPPAQRQSGPNPAPVIAKTMALTPTPAPWSSAPVEATSPRRAQTWLVGVTVGLVVAGGVTLFMAGEHRGEEAARPAATLPSSEAVVAPRVLPAAGLVDAGIPARPALRSVPLVVEAPPAPVAVHVPASVDAGVGRALPPRPSTAVSPVAAPRAPVRPAPAGRRTPVQAPIIGID